MSRLIKIFFIFTTVLFFVGCGAKNESIYSWDGSYMDSVYATLNNENDPTKDIANIETFIKQTNTDGKRVPPGVYAQLGLLYSQTGDNEQALVYFKKESEAFPESKHYMDFIANKGTSEEAQKEPKKEAKDEK